MPLDSLSDQRFLKLSAIIAVAVLKDRFGVVWEKDVDKIKAAGVEIKIDDMEKVFNQISHLTNDKYQLIL